MKIKRKVKKHKDTELEQKIKQTWNESISVLRPCVLCDKLTMNRGIFVPEDASPFGAPDGQEGAFVYPICPMCYSLPHEKIFPLIEQVIFSAMKARTAGLN